MKEEYSFKTFKKTAIVRFLALDKYKYLRENLYKCDVRTAIYYQKRFDAFYRVRRDEKWRNIFFNYFESIKNNKDIRFEDILNHLYKKTGNIEASFSSKMLATINPNMPIWDQYILSNLSLNVEGKTKKERLDNTIKTYYKIVEIENEKLKEKDIKQTVAEFKDYFSEYNLSDIKILDYILWNNRVMKKTKSNS